MLTTKKQSGFTLIEVLVISPILIIAIGGFIGLLVSMVGDVLITRDRNAMTYDVQSAANRIEEDVKLSTQFLTTSGTQVSPQGSNNNFTGTTAFSNNDNSTLILSAVATDENPSKSTRWLVYYANQPNPCGGQQTYNRIFLMKVIYFIKDGGLWRRSIVPTFNTNTSSPNSETICPTTTQAVWQRNSCSPGYSSSTRCQTNDELLVSNVENVVVSYYKKPGDTAPVAANDAKDALTVNVKINGKKTTVGQPVTASASIEATRLNNIDNSLPPPSAPNVTYTLSNETDARFTWNTIPTANTYEVSYNINGGAWVNASLNANTLSYTVNANHSDTVTFRVAAKNVSGTSDYATLAVTMPEWSDLSLASNWVHYGSVWSTPQFARTSSGVVILKGLIKNGTNAAYTHLGTLPEGYRPDGPLIFLAATDGPNTGSDIKNARLDIYPNGDMELTDASTAWYSMDNIAFIPAGSGYTWTTPPFKSGWSNYGGNWQTVRVTKDNSSRVHLQGLAKQGTYVSQTPIAGLTAAYMPSEYLLFPTRSDTAASGNGFVGYGIQPSSNSIVTRGDISTTYTTLNNMYYPSSYTNWSPLPLKAGWIRYSTTFSDPQYTKGSDGIVTLKGLVKSGTATQGTVIATLPAGYRPAQSKIYPVTQNWNLGRVDIKSNGDIVLQIGSSSWTSLDGINFKAEQ